MERKSFRFDVNAPPDARGIIEGYASVFGTADRHGEVVAPGAFKQTLREHPNIPILWQHDPYEPIGVTLSAAEDERGLKTRGELNLDTTRGREAYSLIRQGALRGLSIGYTTVREGWDREQKTRQLKEIRLFEWSPVTFPAHEDAAVTSIKSARELTGLLEIIAETSAVEEKGILDEALLDRALEQLTRLRTKAAPAESDGADEALWRFKQLVCDMPTISPQGKEKAIHER